MEATPWLITIVLLVIIFILLIRLRKKRLDEIVKVQFKQDLLPTPAEGTRWQQDGICYMGDGTIGRVNGLYCSQVRVI